MKKTKKQMRNISEDSHEQRATTNRQTCCVFQPVNGCSAHHSLVKIVCFCIKTLFFGLSFFFLFPFVMQKDGKTCFNAETNDFNQQMACGAPVLWSKYTTQSIQLFCKKLFYYLDTCLWSLFNLSLLRYKTNELQNLSVKEFK